MIVTVHLFIYFNLVSDPDIVVQLHAERQSAVGRRCSAFLLDVGTTFGDSGPMGLSHELSTADVPLQTTDVQTETEKTAIAQVASRARDSVDALAPVSDMHKADHFTSVGVTAYNGADGRQSFSAGGTKVTPIPMHNSPSKSKMNDDKTIVVNKSTNNNNAIKDTSCDVNFQTSLTMAEILKKGEAWKNEESPEAWIKVQMRRLRNRFIEISSGQL
ncbi:unnamed protein product [Parnassius apollo]|uniref:(apollo) hypothetical protein n=1 Tax=Parnassius apollo TaxID=110799 RepID=A0A8S3Y2Q8_PARAO|nr:unnamed protein product [Parnassius apollo]